MCLKHHMVPGLTSTSNRSTHEHCRTVCGHLSGLWNLLMRISYTISESEKCDFRGHSCWLPTSGSKWNVALVLEFSPVGAAPWSAMFVKTFRKHSTHENDNWITYSCPRFFLHDMVSMTPCFMRSWWHLFLCFPHSACYCHITCLHAPVSN